MVPTIELSSWARELKRAAGGGKGGRGRGLLSLRQGQGHGQEQGWTAGYPTPIEHPHLVSDICFWLGLLNSGLDFLEPEQLGLLVRHHG